MDIRLYSVILLSTFTFIFITMTFEHVCAMEKDLSGGQPLFAYTISFDPQLPTVSKSENDVLNPLEDSEWKAYAAITHEKVFSDEKGGDVGATGDVRDNIIFNTPGKSETPGRLKDPTAQTINDSDVRNGQMIPMSNSRFTSDDPQINKHELSDHSNSENPYFDHDRRRNGGSFWKKEEFRSSLNNRLQSMDQKIEGLQSDRQSSTNGEDLKILRQKREDLSNRLFDIDNVSEQDWTDFTAETEGMMNGTE